MDDRYEYADYLDEILDLIFGGNNGIKYYTKMEKYRLSNEERFRYSTAEDTCVMNPEITLKEERPKLNKYSFVENISCGFARVGLKGKQNYVNPDGDELCKEWFYIARDFSDGFACVGKQYKGKVVFNYINTKGKPICDEWLDVDHAYDFHDGLAIIEKDEKQNIINYNGEYVGKKWYDKIYNFHEGYAVVLDNGKYNIIDEEGNTISDEWFDSIEPTQSGNLFGYDGCVVVHRKKGFNYLRKDGKIVEQGWYDIDYNKEKNKFYFTYEGTIVDDMYYDEIYPFYNGARLVRNGNFYNYVDKECHLISKEWFYGGINFEKRWSRDYKNFYFDDNGYAIVTKPIYKNPLSKKEKDIKGVKHNLINIEGKLKSKKWADNVYEGYYNSYNFSYRENREKDFRVYVDLIEKDLKGYKVKEKLNDTYKLIDPFNKRKFNLDYKPIRVLTKDDIICLRHDDKLCIYNTEENDYTLLGYRDSNIINDDYFLSAWESPNYSSIYFIYDDKLLYISDYFKEKLVGKRVININPNISVLSRKEFYQLDKEQRKLLIDELKEKNVKQKEEQEKSKYETELEKQIEESRKEQENLNREYIEQLQVYNESLKKLLEIKSRLKKLPKKKTRPDYMFETIGDHKEMPDIVKMGLQIIDLSIVSFKKVNVSGVDFRGTNIRLDPQEVYNKDLRNCDFTGVYLDPLINFNDSDIRGAKFSYDNDPTTIDLMPRFKNAIYDETTIYNGISLIELIGPCENIKNNRKL